MNQTIKTGILVTGAVAAIGVGWIATSGRCYSSPPNGVGKCIVVLPDGGYVMANGQRTPAGQLRGECVESLVCK